ncbi:MAG: hypothetical protein BroJett042_13510 [Bacteroidota bacterium]|nr:MAG: hypothetical protein UZ12_BCD005000218 [Bacteroidetes bacterium OLB12]GIL22838.1 MAG: hypothetical protein BroJett042_13510 [Bacteroidota bacterium]HNR75432.1 hypothetical protein [Cyclobacteriaceae bacterium]HNU41033.1 hypothetical protein [Cyclobacteriaceae bacterium]
MSKNVLVIGLTLLVFISLGYGFRQRKVATEAVQQKEELEKLVSEHQARAEAYQKMAEVAQQEALVQRTICEEQLKNCK